jgi:hypothetical protein
MAAAIEDSGMGANGSEALGLAAITTLESTALSIPVDGFAPSSARRLNADIRKMANAAVAINFVLNLIVASRTTHRGHQNNLSAGLTRRHAHGKQRTAKIS